jgi:hypothetical protein
MNKKELIKNMMTDAKKQQHLNEKVIREVSKNKTGGETRVVGASIQRDRFIENWNKPVMENINMPRTPIPCTGTSFQCNIAGSGKTPIKNVNMYPSGYDMLGSDIREGGLLGKSYRIPVLHNWHNTGNATKFTKESMRNSYGFENFQ